MHLLPAVRIAEDRYLSAELIYDGVLQETRTKVVYFSPNYWANGSRYGCFEFKVDWQSLLNGRRMYWVEAIRDYQLPIYRFLLTCKDETCLPPMVSYDPAIDDGPIRRVGDDWYWLLGANDYAAEIVIDEDLPLYDVKKMDFWKHHDIQCSEKRQRCPEAGSGGSWRAMAEFMGVLLGRGIHALDDLLTNGGAPSDDCVRALSQTWTRLLPPTGSVGPIDDPDVALDLVRAAALMLQTRDYNRVRRLTGLISDKAMVDEAFLRLVRDHFNAPSFEWSD